MNPTDYAIDATLVLIIFKTIRESEFSLRTLILPGVMLGVAIHTYFGSVPTAGNDVVLYVVLGLTGLLLGSVCGLSTRMRVDDAGTILAQSSVLTIVVWCVGMVGRAVFVYWINHGGQGSIVDFSAAHAITSADAWSTALLLMAVVQVASKLGIQVLRGYAMGGRLVGEPAVA